MNPKTEGTIEIIAALIVMSSAMWDPMVAVTVAVVALAVFGIYRFMQKTGA